MVAVVWKMEKEKIRGGARLHQTWSYDEGAFNGKSVWTVQRAPSLANCIKQTPLDSREEAEQGWEGEGGAREEWCVCYQADLEARGVARMGMRLGFDLARIQARGTDQLLSALSAFVNRTLHQERGQDRTGQDITSN